MEHLRGRSLPESFTCFGKHGYAIISMLPYGDRRWGLAQLDGEKRSR